MFNSRLRRVEKARPQGAQGKIWHVCASLLLSGLRVIPVYKFIKLNLYYFPKDPQCAKPLLATYNIAGSFLVPNVCK